MNIRHDVAYLIIFLLLVALVGAPLYLRRAKRVRRRSGNRGRIDIIQKEE